MAQTQAPDPPTLPPSPTPEVPATQPAALPYTGDLDFILRTALLPESLVSLFVSLIFPIIVLGAGFVIARQSQGEQAFAAGEERVSSFNLARELQIGSQLPQASQTTYVETLKPIILGFFEMAQSAKKMPTATTLVHLENERELELVETLVSLKQQIFDSRLTKEAKDCLDTFIDHLIMTQTFQPRPVPPI